MRRLAELSELLGFDVHVQTDYGDETLGRTPWELFDEDDAQRAVSMAVEAASLAQAIVAEIKPALNSMDDDDAE